MALSRKVSEVFRGLLASYVFTGVALALLAFAVYQFEIGEKMVSFGITATYFIGTVIGGFYTGKRTKEKKYLWGLLLGILYIGIILGASFCVNQGLDSISTSLITTSLLCILGGMVGGMLS